jgi:CBS domain-containing protein
MEFLDLPVKSVMTLHPAAVGPEDPLGAAAKMMVEGGFRHVPVVDADGRVVGMLSERDVRARLGVEVERFPAAASDLLAEEVEATMSRTPITVEPDTPLRDVIGILADERVGALPVVDERERLLGIISYLDLLGYLHAQESGAATTP